MHKCQFILCCFGSVAFGVDWSVLADVSQNSVRARVAVSRAEGPLRQQA